MQGENIVTRSTESTQIPSSQFGKIDISKCPVLSEKSDIIHLEGVEKFEQPMQDYFRLADDMSKIFAINMGIKLKIFDMIEQLGNKTSIQEIKSQLNFKGNERHLNDFLDQLFLHGLLLREGLLENSFYRNSDYTRKYLISSSVNKYSDVFLNLDRYLKKYENFEKNFPSGKTQLFSDEIYSNVQDLRSYMQYFYKSSSFTMDFLLEKIDFSRYSRVVDIHGLAGVLAMKIKRSFPNIEMISFDNKKIQTELENRLKGNDMWESIKVSYGSLVSDKIPESCDCVLAPYVIMQYSWDNKKKILKGIFERLNNNGDLIIIENLLDENREKDDCGMKISFMFSMMGYEGFALSFEEYKKLLGECGFMDISRIPRTGGVSDIIIAKKLDKSL